MRVSYINHASLLIETSGARILTDPWFAGPAYASQWHQFPKPLNLELTEQADTILVSHAHEDHLHEKSLALLDKSKRVFYPFNWYGGTIEWICSMGFGDVTEAISCRTYSLGGRTRVTFVVNGHDSIMVFEDGQEVVINVNDALHSSEPYVIDAFTDYLRQRWPRIDVVLCGFGGASYFPNTIRGPGKNDRAVAWLREQLFAHNFCRIVSRLAPRLAVPFAADFALLADRQRWINDVRFPREWLPGYFREMGGSAEIAIMYSGDQIVNGRLEARSPYRDRIANNNDMLDLLTEQYPTPVSALIVGAPYDDSKIEGLRKDFERSLAEQSRFYDRANVDGLKFSVRLLDVAVSPWFNAAIGPGAGASVTRATEPMERRVAEIDTTAEVLAKCMESEWGGDAIIIGYACDVRVMREQDLRNGLGKLCVELCVRHPRPKAYAMQHPLRIARFLAQTPFKIGAQLRQRARAFGGRSRSIVNGSHWLLDSPGEIRRVCGLPECAPPAVGRLDVRQQ